MAPRAGGPTSPCPLQVDEELSQCSHSIFDFQGALDGILAELVKDRQQVHEDKRFVMESLVPPGCPHPCQAQPLLPPPQMVMGDVPAHRHGEQCPDSQRVHIPLQSDHFTPK